MSETSAAAVRSEGGSRDSDAVDSQKMTTIEGFLCPDCKVNFDSCKSLTDHYKTTHTFDDNDSIISVIGMLRKKKTNTDTAFEVSPSSDKTTVLEAAAKSSLGWTRSRHDEFVQFRKSKMECQMVEVNNRLFRLSKMVPAALGPDRRKQEQLLVEWIDEKFVHNCPFCAKSFHFARRKHHCRLCGAIMCADCTRTMSVKYAANFCYIFRKITFSEVPDENLDWAVEGIKMCDHCLNLLNRKYTKYMLTNTKSDAVTFYVEIARQRDELLPVIAEFKTVCLSLRKGESQYTLREGAQLRQKLDMYLKQLRDLRSKLRENINLNEKLNETEEGDEKQHQLQPSFLKLQKLKRNLCTATTDFIDWNLFALPELPTSVELKSIRQRNEIVVHNWLPEKTKKPAVLSETNNPFLIQIEIVKNYIQQAKDAQKHEEVKSLELNLKMLKKAFKESLAISSAANSNNNNEIPK